MGILRKMVGFLGFVKDEPNEVMKEEEEEEGANADAHIYRAAPAAAAETQAHLPRKGFSVPAQVAVERAPVGPVLVPCSLGDGGIQGFRWYARRLRIDEDGDVADEFLSEVIPEMSLSTEDNHKPLPRFEVKYSTRPAKVSSQALSLDGKIQLGIEHQGKLQWV